MRAVALVPALVIAFVAHPLRAAPPEPHYKLVLQAPPAAAVGSVAVSPDGSLVATAAGEGGVRLYDAGDGRLLRALAGVGDRSVAFSPDGRTLTAGGFHMDKLVGVFDVQTGQRLLALPGQTEWEADATAISPDGKLLVSTGVDKQILVWELPTGRLRHRLKQPARIATLAFSPDGATIATGGGDKKVSLWDVQTGELLKSFSGHSDWVATLAFSPDGRTIASASCDWGFHRGHDWPRPAGRGPERSEWRLWDVATGQLKRTVEETGHLLSVAFAPDGKSLAVAVENDLRLYELASAGQVRVVTSHAAVITSIAFTPDGAAVITGSHDQTVRRTDPKTGVTQWQAPGYFEQVNTVALSDDASLLVTGSSDHRFTRNKIRSDAPEIGPGAVRLWDARTGRMLRRLDDGSEQVMAVAISPDRRRIAGGAGNKNGAGVVRAWDAESGELIWHADHDAREVLAVAFSPDGSRLATGCADGTVKVCDAESGVVTCTLPDHPGGATSLVFSSDGTVLHVGPGHGGVKVWDARDGRLLYQREGVGSAAVFTADRLLNSIGLSRDGATLATCLSSVNNEFVDPVRLWDAGSGAPRRHFTSENIHGRPMALSPDGTIVATGGKSVKLWDARTGTLLRELFGHLKRTQSIVFSADGRRLVAGGSYGTTNIWEVATGRHLVTLFAFAENHGETVTDAWLAYHADGYYHGSPGIERYLAWRMGEEFQTPATLSPELHQPGKVETALRVQN